MLCPDHRRMAMTSCGAARSILSSGREFDAPRLQRFPHCFLIGNAVPETLVHPCSIQLGIAPVGTVWTVKRVWPLAPGPVSCRAYEGFTRQITNSNNTPLHAQCLLQLLMRAHAWQPTCMARAHALVKASFTRLHTSAVLQDIVAYTSRTYFHSKCCRYLRCSTASS